MPSEKIPPFVDMLRDRYTCETHAPVLYHARSDTVVGVRYDLLEAVGVDSEGARAILWDDDYSGNPNAASNAWRATSDIDTPARTDSIRQW